MAGTLVSLRAAHPEFETAPDVVVQSAIDEATDRVECSIFGTRHDAAVTWLACYLVSTSPYSRDKRRNGTLDVPEGYLDQYERIARSAGRAHRWISGQTS